jgi:hypothetical protein
MQPQAGYFAARFRFVKQAAQEVCKRIFPAEIAALSREKTAHLHRLTIRRATFRAERICVGRIARDK